MAQEHVPSGQIASVRPLGADLGSARTTALLKAEQLEVIRIVLLAGSEFREHRAPGEITVQCLEGCIEFSSPQGLHTMTAGAFIHLRRNEPHALKAKVDSSALLTICLVSDLLPAA